MPDAAHDLPAHRELSVALAEPVVGHGRLALRARLVAVLRVQPLERDPDPGELAVHALPVGVGVDGLGESPSEEQPPVRLGVGHRLGLAPADARLPRGGEDLAHAVARHALRRGDPPAGEAGLAQLEHQPRPYSSRRVLPPSSRLHGETKVPAPALTRNAGGSEPRYRVGGRMAPSRNIGGLKKDDYSPPRVRRARSTRGPLPTASASDCVEESVPAKFVKTALSCTSIVDRMVRRKCQGRFFSLVCAVGSSFSPAFQGLHSSRYRDSHFRCGCLSKRCIQ